MNFKKLINIAFIAVLTLSTACKNSEPDVELPKGAYENGILVVNEGTFSTPSSDVTFVSQDLSKIENGIYKTNNDGASLGSILQTVGLSGDNAYLVMNGSNKIVIADRYTFKKKAEVTNNIDNPRYIAFSENKYYVTNNNFVDVKKLNIYNNDNTFVKSIDFDRQAEKVVEANGNIVVQTDGVTYDMAPPYNELPTGYTITIVNGASSTINKVVTLPSQGIIRDLISYSGDAYALASDGTGSYIYKINSKTGVFTTVSMPSIPSVQKLRIDSGKFYFVDAANHIYSMDMGSTTAPTTPLVTSTGYLYGFNVIDGNIYVSDASFTGQSTVYVYNATTGAAVKNFKAGTGTNGFFKN